MVRPRPVGSAEYGKMDGGHGLSLPEQPIASAQGQEAGNISPHEGTLFERLKTTMGRLLEFLTPSAVPPPLLLLAPDHRRWQYAGRERMVCREVEVMRQEMEEAFVQSDTAGRLTVYTTTGVSLSLTAGIGKYLFHSGSLLSGFLATIPLWKGFDPVAVLSTPKNDRKDSSTISPSVGVETADQKAETMFVLPQVTDAAYAHRSDQPRSRLSDNQSSPARQIDGSCSRLGPRCLRIAPDFVGKHGGSVLRCRRTGRPRLIGRCCRP